MQQQRIASHRDSYPRWKRHEWQLQETNDGTCVGLVRRARTHKQAECLTMLYPRWAWHWCNQWQKASSFLAAINLPELEIRQVIDASCGENETLLCKLSQNHQFTIVSIMVNRTSKRAPDCELLIRPRMAAQRNALRNSRWFGHTWRTRTHKQANDLTMLCQRRTWHSCNLWQKKNIRSCFFVWSCHVHISLRQGLGVHHTVMSNRKFLGLHNIQLYKWLLLRELRKLICRTRQSRTQIANSSDDESQ